MFKHNWNIGEENHAIKINSFNVDVKFNFTEFNQSTMSSDTTHKQTI